MLRREKVNKTRKQTNDRTGAEARLKSQQQVYVKIKPHDTNSRANLTILPNSNSKANFIGLTQPYTV